MDINTALKKFGSAAGIARAFGVKPPAVSRWIRLGKVPQQRVWQYKAGLVKPPKGR
jgi:DNA-binding transcriptional regulator YdaS (Cro superfamily)